MPVYRIGEGCCIELVEISKNTGFPNCVEIDPFLIGKYPVTQEQYIAIMGNNPSYFKGDRKPVESVNYRDCVDFCGKLQETTGMNFRLPLVAEWEYACFGGTLANYPSYSDAWYKENSEGTTHSVGGLLPNLLGLYDMLGNVWEWCSDVCVDSDKRRLCGGSWSNNPRNVRCAGRPWDVPDDRAYDIGFRVVVSSR
ncbi:MAG: formylglycine-generating enzyme family protein [bacterium]|nr:formylglycine-generating enzyme family protein [bacterium]